MGHNRLTDKDGFDVQKFILEVQMGHIPHASYIWKFGYSDINTAGVQNTVWDHNAGLYPYHLGYGVDAKAIDLVSSVPLSDDGLQVGVYGLDADGNEQREVVLIGGTSTFTWSRVFRMRNHNGTLITGEVNAYPTGTTDILAHIDTAAQATLMSMFTIPKGMAGFLHKGTVSLGSGKDGVVDWMIREVDHVFTIGERMALYQNTVEADRPFLPIKELSDVEVRFLPTQANTPISANFGILLLDLEHFDMEHLSSTYSPI